MRHELKTWPPFFADIVSGAKPFELRRDDRGYTVGDVLHLREWDPATGDYTGRDVLREVSYIIRDAPDFGLMPGFVVLGLWEYVAPLSEEDKTAFSRRLRAAFAVLNEA